MNENQKLKLCQRLVQLQIVEETNYKAALEACRNVQLATEGELLAFLGQHGLLIGGLKQAIESYQQAVRTYQATEMDRASPHDGPKQTFQLHEGVESSYVDRGRTLPPPYSAAAQEEQETLTHQQAGNWPAADPRYAQANLPEKIGNDHKVVGCLGAGAFGVVYRCWNERLERDEALKVLKYQLDPNDRYYQETLDRIWLEAKAMGGISHPNVVRIHRTMTIGADAGGLPILVMEYIKGCTLQHAVMTQVRSPEESMELFRDICSGLKAVHDKDMLHRDLKPANIMVRTSGHPVVMDFGLVYRDRADLAREIRLSRSTVLEPSSRLTQDGDVMGTLVYMPPEQLEGQRNLTPAADVYSLGKILFFMLTGQVMHQDVCNLISNDLFLRVLQNELLPGEFYENMRELEIAPAIQAMLEKCLAPDASDRYQDASELLEAVDGYFEMQKEAREKAEAQRKMLRTILFALCPVVVLLACLVGGLAWGRSQARARANVEAKLRQEAEAREVAQSKLTQAEKRVQEELFARLEAKEKHDQVAKHQTAAQNFMKRCEWQKAKTELDAAISLEEHYYPARTLRAQVLFNMWDLDCEKDRLWLMENGPEEHVSEHGFYAIFHTENLLPSGEVRDYSEVLEKISNPHYLGLARAYLLANKADVMQKSGFLADAERKKREALTILDGLEIDWLTRLIRAYALAQSENDADQQKAMRLLGNSCAENPDSPMSFFLHGLVLRMLAQYESSKVRTQDTLFHRQLARVYFEQAAVAFRRMVYLMPSSSSARINLADCLVESVGLSQDPSSHQDSLRESLEVLSKLRFRSEKAAREKSTEVKLIYSQIWFLKYIIHRKSGELEEAEESRQKGVKLLRYLSQLPALKPAQSKQVEMYLQVLSR